MQDPCPSHRRFRRAGRSALLARLLPVVVTCGLAHAQGPPAPEALAAWLVPEGAPVRTVDTIAEMRAFAQPGDGLHFIVRGYHRAGDDGGGVFRYEAASEAAADAGLVIAPAEAPGRFVRLYDPEADVYAEWFGAWGDGDAAAPHDDQEAINACLEAFGRVRLLARTYGLRGKPEHYNPDATYHAIDLATGYRIEGVDRERSRLLLLDGADPKGTTPSDNYFAVIGNRRFHERADHVIIRDLTVDCNFNGQNMHTTINAIRIRGGNALVERVNVRRYGTGRNPESGSSREAFVVAQGLVYKDREGSRRAATFRDIDFARAGHNGAIEGNVAEITHMLLGGAHNFDNYGWIMPGGHDPDFDPADGGENESNWWPSYGGLVEGCTFRDVPYDPALQKSPLNAITYNDCIGLTVRGNRVANFEGAAVYVMSWWNRATTIVDNDFDGVSIGLALEAKGQGGVSLQAPRHEDVLFARNRIRLGAPPHFRYSPRGVHLYGQHPSEGLRFNRIVVRSNTISGRAYRDAAGVEKHPVGILVQNLHAGYRDLRFEENTIDVPDFSSAGWVPQEHGSLSMTYFPLARWDEDMQSGSVIYRDNRNPAGEMLHPILADWHFNNAPLWGLPPHRPGR